MAHRYPTLLIFIWLLSISACQSSPPRAFQFDTRITADGYKLFQLVYPQEHVELRLPGANTNRRPQTEGVSEHRAVSMLEQMLKANGYCRQGYILLGRAGGETSNRLRGECRERANAQDRRDYPNTIERW